MASAKGPGDSVATKFGYDARGRLATVDYPTTADVNYGFDRHGNRTSMTDGAGTTTYGYDDFDRLTTVTRGTSQYTYGYNKVGLVVASDGPGGPRTFTYDHDGLMASAGTSTGTVLETYDYDAAGQPVAATAADGSHWTRGYDTAGRLSAITDVAEDGTLLVDQAIERDGVGNPVAITQAAATPQVTDTYTYDTRDRLTAVCYNTTTCAEATDYVRWSYDADDNRTTEQRPTGTTTYSHDPTTGRLSGYAGPSGTVSYSYDTAGRLANDGTTTYAYNQANVLTSQTTGGVTTSYTYDGDGRRLKAQVGGSGNPASITQLYWDPRSYSLRAEADGSGTLQRSYIDGVGTVGFTTTAGTSFAHTDLQGSIVAVTGPDGDPDSTTAFEPYGQVRDHHVIDTAAPTAPLGWAGQYTEVTGDSFLRARTYNPTIGAFTTPDPAASTSASATYTYAGANPMTSSDPYGLYGLTDFVHDVNAVAPVVASVAAVGALVFPPLAVVTVGASLIGAAASAYVAYDVCHSGKGSCAAAITEAALNAAMAIPGMRLARIGSRAANTESGLIRSRLALRNERGAVELPGGGRVHNELNAASRGVDVEHVWANGDLYIQAGDDSTRLVRVLTRGGGQNDVVIRELDGTPVTSMVISDESLAARIADGRWQ